MARPKSDKNLCNPGLNLFFEAVEDYEYVQYRSPSPTYMAYVTGLNENQCEVLMLRFSSSELVRMSLRDIGKRCGVSGERIRQIVMSAIGKLNKKETRDILLNHLKD